jgi:hypothetical protein
MSQFYIHLKVEPYLADWIHNHFGNPVKLMKDSPESMLLKRFLDKQPIGAIPDDGNIEIEIPWYKEKDARVYNYLSPKAKEALVESFDSLFTRNMWSEIGSLENINCKITTVIYAYLEKHNIEEKHWETIRQKYYRLRKNYLTEKSIKIS